MTARWSRWSARARAAAPAGSRCAQPTASRRGCASSTWFPCRARGTGSRSDGAQYRRRRAPPDWSHAGSCRAGGDSVSPAPGSVAPRGLPGRFALLPLLLFTVVLPASLLAASPVHAGPSAPADLTAKAGNTQVTLAWTDPGDATITKYQFRYQVGVSLWTSWTDVPGSSASTTSHTLGGLLNDTPHKIELRAVRGSVAGAAASVSATPRPPPPPAPTGFSARAGDASVTLTWSNPNDATVSSYGYRYQPSGGKWTAWQGFLHKGSTFTLLVRSLNNGTTYTFELRAVRGIYTFGPSVSTTATPTLGPPFAPHGLTATSGDGQIKWTWSLDDPPISRFQYRLSDDGGTTWDPDWTDVPGSSAATTSYVTTGLTNGTEYRFEVRAVRGQLLGAGTGTAGRPRAGGPIFVQPPATTPGTTPPGSTPPGSASGGGGAGSAGGGGAGGPSSSLADFEWNVTRDIEALHADHDAPAGMWSDGATLWIAQNASGAADAVYAYDLRTGDRVEEREFALDAAHRAPRG
ncbi:MAG: fibronectin type III domain-containing protein, partial [Acidobacteria bacterium]|nr:fibronectin type III domain-containing protein [Acidobacteriota bacterium]